MIVLDAHYETHINTAASATSVAPAQLNLQMPCGMRILTGFAAHQQCLLILHEIHPELLSQQQI